MVSTSRYFSSSYMAVPFKKFTSSVFKRRPQPQTTVAMETQETERPSGTREVNRPIFTPSLSDVHELIAAIAKIETKEQKDKDHQPSSSPARNYRRLSKVLDSIANLCVSETHHEVIATAFRVHNKAESIELIIASNTNIKSSTEDHLRDMWKVLKKISTSYHNSPKGMRPQLAPDTHDLEAKFRQLCLEFSFGKLQKRINGKFSRFSRHQY